MTHFLDCSDCTGLGCSSCLAFAVDLKSEDPRLPKAHSSLLVIPYDNIALGVTGASLSTEKREALASYPYRLAVNAHVPDL